MIGVSKDVEKQLAAYPPAVVEKWFSRYSHVGEVRVKYSRSSDGKDLTSWLPSSRHMSYVAKGWQVVEIDPSSIPQSARV
jgi:hypothetical protein